MNKIWESLTISNDFIFSKLMKDKEICKEVLEEMLEIKIGKIDYIEDEKTIDLGLSSKGIRLDVYLEDENRSFNVEMQISNKPNLIKRSRYYQSLIDLNNLQEGEDYEELKESYIIFICTFDLFKKGLPKYTFENVCQEDSYLKLEDGVKKIFFNTKDFKKVENENLKALLQYINGEPVNNKLVSKLDEKVKLIKNNDEWRREFMAMRVKELDIAKENYSLGKQEGIQQGIQQGKLEGIKNFIQILKEFNLSTKEIVTKISKEFNISEEEVKKYL